MPEPGTPEPAEPTETAAVERASTPAGPSPLDFAIRSLLGLCGAGLVVGFFLPWVRLGEVMSMSGFGLSVTGGEAAGQLAGPSSGLLFVIPLAGALLVFTAIRGPRGVAWVGLASGFLIFAVGLYTLIRVFLDSTGTGMWVVAISAVLATLISLLAVRRST